MPVSTDDAREFTDLSSWVERPRADGVIRMAEDDGHNWATRNQAQLADQVRAFADILATAGAGPGEVVAVAVPTGFDAVVAIFASWRTGAAVNLLPPPLIGAGEDYREHLKSLLLGSRATMVVVDPKFRGHLAGPANEVGIEKLLQVGEGASGPPIRSVNRRPIRADDTAVVQFTSGSSGAPKGVRISWRGLASNTAYIVGSVEWCKGDSTVSWLPLYHDMGLVGGLLSTLSVGGDLWLMRPDQFIRNPEQWVRALADVQHTVSPSFGLGYAARRVTGAEVAGLDFSRLRTVITGAEPISPADVFEFTRLLAPGGFDLDTLRPAYGLAEATLMVTIRQDGPLRLVRIKYDAAIFGKTVPITEEMLLGDEEPAGAGWIWGMGSPANHTEVDIVDADGRALPSGTLGEVVVRGPGVAAEYQSSNGEHGDPAPTKLDNGELRTGDAGFFHAGDLYVIGRMGSSLKVRGRPLFMEVVDERVAAETGLPKKLFAAVAMQDGSPNPGLVLFAETEPGNWMTTVRNLLRADLGPDPRVQIVTGDRGLILRTSSGKPRRRVMWERYLSGGFDEIIHSANQGQFAASVIGGRRRSLSRLSDGDVHDLLTKALRQVSVQENAAIVLEGSIAEGFGNEGSDVDFLVVSPGAENTPGMPTVLFIDGRRVEVRTRSEGQLRRQLAYIREANSSTNKTLLALDQDILNRCQRFLRSVTIRDGDVDVAEIKSSLSYDAFAFVIAAWWRARATQSLRQGMAMTVLEQADGQGWLRDGLLQAVKSWTATKGETYIESKWTGPQLDRIGNAALAERYYKLDEMQANGAAEVSQIIAFAEELGSSVGGGENAVLLSRAAKVTSWPIDGRIHVVRGDEVFVLSDDAALCWRALVFRRPLAELAERLDAERRGIVAEFVRFGLIGLAWTDGEPITPAVAMVKPLSPITPPPSKAVLVVGLGGGAVERHITLSSLPAKRFVECASGLIWSNVLIENAREDLLGALSQGQRRVAYRAADRMVKATARAALSCVGVTPLPADVSPAETLEWLLPEGFPRRAETIDRIRAAESISFARGDVVASASTVAKFDEMVSLVRLAAGITFPTSFNSHSQWRATLDITYDWLRLAAFLDAELPIDEVADLLSSGGAQPHEPAGTGPNARQPITGGLL